MNKDNGRRTIGQFLKGLFTRKNKPVKADEKKVFNKPDKLVQGATFKWTPRNGHGGKHDRCHMHKCYLSGQCGKKGIQVDPLKKACSKAV